MSKHTPALARRLRAAWHARTTNTDAHDADGTSTPADFAARLRAAVQAAQH